MCGEMDCTQSKQLRYEYSLRCIAQNVVAPDNVSRSKEPDSKSMDGERRISTQLRIIGQMIVQYK